MSSQLSTIFIALVAGIFGGYIGSSLNHSNNDVGNFLSDQKKFSADNKTHRTNPNLPNPFQTQNISDNSEYQFESLLLKIEGMQIQIEALQKKQQQITTTSDNKKNTYSSTPNKEALISAGITPDVAEDILRRISQQDFRRLELQNLIQRSNPTQRRQYSQELREINRNKISLRKEMGDENYDQYLYTSGQNNRVKVRSVMAGSPAESSGFEAGDIILSYDNKKILAWPDIRAATIEGEIGSYTSVEVLRDGEQISLTVPRGTLGVQLDPAKLNPKE